MKGGGCFFLDLIYMGTFPANDSSWLGGAGDMEIQVHEEQSILGQK